MIVRIVMLVGRQDLALQPGAEPLRMIVRIVMRRIGRRLAASADPLGITQSHRATG